MKIKFRLNKLKGIDPILLNQFMWWIIRVLKMCFEFNPRLVFNPVCVYLDQETVRVLAEVIFYPAHLDRSP